ERAVAPVVNPPNVEVKLKSSDDIRTSYKCFSFDRLRSDLTLPYWYLWCLRDRDIFSFTDLTSSLNVSPPLAEKFKANKFIKTPAVHRYFFLVLFNTGMAKIIFSC